MMSAQGASSLLQEDTAQHSVAAEHTDNQRFRYGTVCVRVLLLQRCVRVWVWCRCMRHMRCRHLLSMSAVGSAHQQARARVRRSRCALCLSGQHLLISHGHGKAVAAETHTLLGSKMPHAVSVHALLFAGQLFTRSVRSLTSCMRL